MASFKGTTQGRLLITGSSGRLGGALALHLAAEHEIVQLDVLESPTDELRGLGPVFQGSITDVPLVEQAMEGVDAVVHCAAFPGPIQPFDELMETNVQGTFVLLEEAGKRDTVDRFIYLSSIQWHGLHEEHGALQLPEFLPITEDHPSLSTGYYDTSKVLGEHLCRVYTQRFGKPCVAMRPGWIITEEVEPAFKALLPPMHPHLNDYVGTSDLVDAVRRLLDYDPPDGFEAFLFNAEDQRSTMPSLELAEKFFPGIPVDSEKLEACDGFGALVECTRARERLQWKPKFRCQR
ncbi:MAG: NAD(P)-dependent oxidoreductase [Candidatus Hydrogenedentes bacterium]|nr:NAD(P)-dependent oxidoreductase [Candidatus Hydrogenedentota bacterium]